MRHVISVVLLLLLSGPVFAQERQVVCRDLDGGGYVGPDETIMNKNGRWVACHLAPAKPAVTNQAVVESVESVPAPAPIPTMKPTSPVGSMVSSRQTPRVQTAVGYQYGSAKLSDNYGTSTPRANFNGAFVQVVGNLSRYLSLVGNLDGTYHSELAYWPYMAQPYRAKFGLLSYTGGVQTYPIGHKRFQPFGRFTVGATTLLLDWKSNYTLFAATGCSASGGSCRHTGFTYQVGGGIEYKLRPESRLRLRLGQFDYSHATNSGINLSTVKFGTGITF